MKKQEMIHRCKEKIEYYTGVVNKCTPKVMPNYTAIKYIEARKAIEIYLKELENIKTLEVGEKGTLSYDGLPMIRFQDEVMHLLEVGVTSIIFVDMNGKHFRIPKLTLSDDVLEQVKKYSK